MKLNLDVQMGPTTTRNLFAWNPDLGLLDCRLPHSVHQGPELGEIHDRGIKIASDFNFRRYFDQRCICTLGC